MQIPQRNRLICCKSKRLRI